MSKRKSNEISTSAAVDETSSSGRPARAKRNAAAASSTGTVAAADSSATAVAAASSAAVEDDGDSEMVSKPVRRGGRPAASTDIRPAQQEAMSHVANLSVHGLEYPSFYGFKKLEWMKKRAAVAGPGRQWKNYKQIVERENYHLMEPNAPTFASMHSSPSSLPAQKYCDLTGFPARYTDPKTHLHYYSAKEYQQIKMMHTETIKQMLEMRGQTPSHQLMLRIFDSTSMTKGARSRTREFKTTATAEANDFVEKSNFAGLDR